MVASKAPHRSLRSAVTPDIPALAETPQLKASTLRLVCADNSKMPAPVVAKPVLALNEFVVPDLRKKP
jgi:hypothetical protein